MPKSVYAVAVGWCRGQGEGDFSRTQPYSQANFGDDHSIFDSGFVLSLANALVEAMLSGADVELPAVPGAGQNGSTEHRRRQRFYHSPQLPHCCPAERMRPRSGRLLPRVVVTPASAILPQIRHCAGRASRCRPEFYGSIPCRSRDSEVPE